MDREEGDCQRVKDFYQMTTLLFSKPERLITYKILNDYRCSHDLEKLVVGLKLVIKSYTQLELLKYVRYILWEGHVSEFDRMTHFHKHFRARRRERKNHRLSPVHDNRSVASSSTVNSKSQIRDVRVFTIHRRRDETSLGFSVRGGSEHGLEIYVSEIDAGSTAEEVGIRVGDKILEVNNISFKSVASSSAVRVLTGSNRLKIVVQRANKVPEWKQSREKMSWYDVRDNKMIIGKFEECGIAHNSLDYDEDMPERRVILNLGKSDRSLGFNIRGGKEYGVGIYVSKQRRLSTEEWVRVGDQIIDVNGIPFDNIIHAHAVEVMKGKRHTILTLRDVGRFPLFKELYVEYTWSESPIHAAKSLPNLRNIRLAAVEMANKVPSTSDLLSSQKRPSSVPLFFPNAAKEIHTNYATDDDSVSRDDGSDYLINLEDLANAVPDAGSENFGYASSDKSQRDVIIHSQTEKFKIVSEDNSDEVKHACNAPEWVESRSESNNDVVEPKNVSNIQRAKTEEPFDTVNLEKRLKELKNRQSTSGIVELNVQKSESKQDVSTHSTIKKINKAKRMEKIDIMNMAVIEEAARQILNEDEVKAVFRHINTYHETHELDRLVEVLLILLDKPEKILLLKDVRSVIYPMDLAAFDNGVRQHEIEAYQKLSMKLRLPPNHRYQKRPRKKIITAEIAKDSHFHLKSIWNSKAQNELVVQRDETEVSKSSNKRLREHADANHNDKSDQDHFEYLETAHSDNGRSDTGSNIAAISEHSYHSSNEIERVPVSVIVHLSKNKQDIGLDLEEIVMNDVKNVRIRGIDSKGAAYDDSNIEVGMTLLAVDKQKVDGLSLDEVNAILERSYADKHIVSMNLLLLKPHSTDL